MKTLLTLFLLVAFSVCGFAASPSAKGRTLVDLNVIPARVLQRSISPWFFQSLLVSPIEGWIVVRAQLLGTKVVGGRVIRSDLDGAFDALALQRAAEMKIQGREMIDRLTPLSPVLVHLLVYRIADGTMALSFAALDGAGDNQLDYFGCAKLRVLQGNGRWVELKGPPGLEGKGLAVMAPRAVDILKAKNIYGKGFN